MMVNFELLWCLLAWSCKQCFLLFTRRLVVIIYSYIFNNKEESWLRMLDIWSVLSYLSLIPRWSLYQSSTIEEEIGTYQIKRFDKLCFRWLWKPGFKPMCSSLLPTLGHYMTLQIIQIGENQIPKKATQGKEEKCFLIKLWEDIM